MSRWIRVARETSECGGGRRRLVLASALGFLLAAGLAPAAVAQQPTFGKVFSPDTIGPGSTTILTFTIANDSAVAVSDLAFSDTLPPGVTIADPPRATTTCGAAGATLTATAAGSTITFSGGTVRAGKSCIVKVNIIGSTVGTHMNVSGDLTSSAGNSGTAADDLMVVASLPGFSKSFAPSTIEVGGRSTLTFTFDNTLNAAPETLLRFTDVLPPGMVIAGPANATTDCGTPPFVPTITAVPGTSSIQFDVFGTASFPAIGAGGMCTFLVDVTTTVAGSLGNVSGQLDTSGSDNTGFASDSLVSIAAALGLQKKFLDDPVPVGGLVTLQFRIDNRSRNFTATGITFTDDLDFTPSMGITLAAGPTPDPPCGAGSTLTLAAGDVLTLAGGTLAPGASCTFTVTLGVPVSETPGAHVNTTGAVSGTVGGAPVVGNTATDVLFVDTLPIFTKEFTDDPVGASGTVTLEFTIANTDPGSALTDIEFEDDLNSAILGLAANGLIAAGGLDPDPIVDPCGSGSELTIFDLNDSGLPSPPFPNFPPDPTMLIFTGGSLAAAGTMGDSCTFSVVLDVPVVPGGIYTNTTGDLTADQGMTPIVRAPASGDLVVLGAPRLTKDFTDDPVEPGDLVTLEFELTHSIGSPGDATGITFTDDLAGSTGIAGLKAAAGELPKTDLCGPGNGTLAGSAGDTLLTFSGGTLAPGATCTFSLLVEVPAGATGGIFTNTTSTVSATVDGAASTSREATADLVVAQVAFSKEFTDDPVLPDGSATLEFNLTNLSPEAVTGISFTDNLDPDFLENVTVSSLPAGGFCGAGSTISFTTGSLVVIGGSLAPAGSVGDSCTFSVTLDIPAAALDGIYPNTTSDLTATVGSTPTTLPPAVDALTVDSDLLFLTKEFTDDPVTPGDTVNLRFTIDNLDLDDPISAIAFSDDLDAALSGLKALGLPIAACGGTLTTPDGGATIVLSGGSLAAGGSCFFDVTVEVPAGATGGTALNTTSTISGTLGGLPVVGGSASDTLKIFLVQFSKAFAGPAVAGGTVNLTFTLTNVSATDTVSGLAFSDNLAGMVAGAAATNLPLAGVCGAGSAVTGTSTVSFTGGSLGPGAACAFTVTVAIPAATAAGTYPNTTSAVTASGLPAADPATADLTVVTEADLSIVKADSPDPVVTGNLLTYTLTVTNNGPSDAQNVVVTDTLPAGTTLPVTAGCVEDPSGVPTCTLGTIAAGASTQYTITVTVDLLGSATIVNNADVAASTIDPDSSNNSASEATAVIADFDFGDAPDPTYPTLLASDGARHLQPSILFLGGAVDVDADGQPSAGADGDDLAGVDDEDGVVFTGAVVAGDTAGVDVTASAAGLLNAWVDFNADGDWADPGEQVFTDEPLAAGVNALSFVVPADAAGGDTFARFRADTGGGLMPTGAAADGEVEDHAVTIELESDLAVTIGAESDPVAAHTVQLYALDVSNDGPSDAAAVTLEQELPAGTYFLGVAPDTVSCTLSSGIALSCDLGPLAAGDSTVVTVGVFIDGRFEGQQSSEAMVSLGGPGAATDPDPSNDEDDVTVLVARARAMLATNRGTTPALAIVAKEAEESLGIVVADAAGGGARDYSLTSVGYRPVALAEVPSFGDTPSPELAILGFGFDGSVKVDVVDAGSTTLLGSHPVPGGPWVPIDLASVPSFAGTPAPELAVLLNDLGDGSVHVVVMDAGDGAVSRDVTVVPGPDGFGLGMAVLSDFSGSPVPEVGVTAMLRTGRIDSISVDLELGSTPTAASLAGFGLFPLDVAAVDAGGSPSPDLAFLARRPSDGALVVEILDLDPPALLPGVSFDPGLKAAPMAVVPNFAGTPAPELAVLGRVGGDLVVETRDAVSGSVVGGTTISGVPSPLPLGLAVHPSFGGIADPDVSVLFEAVGSPTEVSVFDASGAGPLFNFILP